jgi:AcrR family transcriptional regulator
MALQAMTASTHDVGPTGPLRDRARATDERRRAILRAALACFAERGYEATGIDDVRRRSGASVGSIYHHFGSKQALFGALHVEGLADYQTAAVALLQRGPGARAGIEGLVRHHLDWVSANADLARFLLAGRETEVRLASEAGLREANRDFFAAVEAWLEPHVAAGRVRRLPFDVFYALLIGPSQEFTRHWLAGRTAGSPQSAGATLADAAWRSLKANEGEAS